MNYITFVFDLFKTVLSLLFTTDGGFFSVLTCMMLFCYLAYFLTREVFL